MCVTCVAEGATYVGGAVVGLRLMAARAGMRTRRAATTPGAGATDTVVAAADVDSGEGPSL